MSSSTSSTSDISRFILSLDTLGSSYAIHRSAWNRNSANFAITEFSEVRAGLRRVASCLQWQGMPRRKGGQGEEGGRTALWARVEPIKASQEKWEGSFPFLKKETAQ